MNKYELNNLLDKIDNHIIGKALLTTFHKLNYWNYKKALCSISGGADSDIVLDLVTKCDNNKIVDYVYFDTGYQRDLWTHNLIKMIKYLASQWRLLFP